MKLSDFDYHYPQELVAQHPLKKRDASRMMVVERTSKKTTHSHVKNLPNFLQDGDLIVVNDSKVIPARLFGKKSNGQPIELLVVEPVNEKGLWRCLAAKAKRMMEGDQFFFGMQATAKVKGRDGIFLIVEFKENSLEVAIKHHGVPPLPPYIERQGFKAYTEEDRERYQTVFAKNSGSAAAPTAGLHLSDELLEAIKKRGASIAHVTLHIGIDTFAPVRVDNLSSHKMHGEKIEITKNVADEINKAKSEKRRVIAIGTTTTRTLESMTSPDGEITAGQMTTDLFITPGYKFKIVDAMLTNFHQPKSTLIVLVSAFAGREFILSCYKEAIRKKYRLFSFGDCMLIL